MAFTNDWDADVGLIPEIPFTTSISFVTLISKGERGKQRRRSKADGPMTWKLNFPILDDTDTDLAWDFYINCKGAYDSFAWIDPVTSVGYTVHFKQDNLAKEYFSNPNLHKLSLEFEEII